MKTKFYLFAAASATMLFASCTQDEVVNAPSSHSNAIGFGTYVSNTARNIDETNKVVDTDLAFLKSSTTGNGFYVIGSYSDEANSPTQVFNGVDDQSHVQYTGNQDPSTAAWGYAPLQYWILDQTYKFAAYGPAAAKNMGTVSFDYTNTKLTLTDFTTNGTTDLVIAEGRSSGYKKTDPNTPMDKVEFKFFHVLSKVRFTIKNGWTGLVAVKINNVKISGVKDKNTLTSPGTLANAGSTTSAAVTNVWSGTQPSGSATYTLYTDNNTSTIDDIHGYTYESYGNALICDAFLLPQTIDGNITLEFWTQVSNSLGTGPDLGNGEGKGKLVTVTIPNDNVSEWKPGVAYNYTLELNGPIFGVYPIQFNVTEDPIGWGDAFENENIQKDDLQE